MTPRPICLEPCSQSIVPVQNYITAILVFLIIEQLMTWGFYGMPKRLFHVRSRHLTISRLPKPTWIECFRQSTHGYCCRSKCSKKLLFILPSPNCLYGLRSCQAVFGSDHDLGPRPRHYPFCVWCRLCRRKFVNHARQCRFARTHHCSSTGRYPNGLLRLDSQLPECDDEGSCRQKTEDQGDDVQEALVVHLGQHHCHFRVLLHQLICFCGPR